MNEGKNKHLEALQESKKNAEFSTEKVLEFSEVHITPDKPFEFSTSLNKRPLEIKDGDTLGGNATEVKFEGKLADLMSKAAELKTLPENERILKLLELVRGSLAYPYSEIVKELKETNPDLGKWLEDRFGDKARIIYGVSVNDCLDKGYGNCKIMASTFLVLAQEAGLKGIYGQNDEDKVINLERPDTGKPMFKMGEVGKAVNFSHAWAEVQLQNGEWVPVDITANMAAVTPEMSELFKKANYKIQAPVLFEGMPSTLDRNPPAVKFEPGQAGGNFKMKIVIRKIDSHSKEGFTSRPATEKFVGGLRLSLQDSQENKSTNLSL